MSQSTLSNYSYITPAGVIVACTILPALSVIVLGLRFYARRKQRVKLMADDWLLVPGLIFLLGIAVCLIFGVKKKAFAYRTPPFPTDLTPEQLLGYLPPALKLATKLEFAIGLLQTTCLACIKLSFIFFYRRIFCRGGRTWFSIATAVLAVIVVLWMLTFLLTYTFQCKTDFSFIFASAAETSIHCPLSFKNLEAISMTDFLLDLCIITLPIPMIWKLHIDTKRKLMVAGVFLLGGIAVAASIVRLVIYFIIGTDGFNTHEDGSLVVTLGLFWIIIECGCAFIASCLPTIRVLFGKISIDSIINSVRSALSLHSLHSVNFRQAQPDTVAQSNVSQNFINKASEESDAHAYEMGTAVSFQKSRGKFDDDGVIVHKTVSQEDV